MRVESPTLDISRSDTDIELARSDVWRRQQIAHVAQEVDARCRLHQCGRARFEAAGWSVASRSAAEEVRPVRDGEYDRGRVWYVFDVVLQAVLIRPAGLTMMLFTRCLGWSRAEVEVFLADVRKEAMDKRIHSYYHL
jgi:hypothetical protein